MISRYVRTDCHAALPSAATRAGAAAWGGAAAATAGASIETAALRAARAELGVASAIIQPTERAARAIPVDPGGRDPRSGRQGRRPLRRRPGRWLLRCRRGRRPLRALDAGTSAAHRRGAGTIDQVGRDIDTAATDPVRRQPGRPTGCPDWPVWWADGSAAGGSSGRSPGRAPDRRPVDVDPVVHGAIDVHTAAIPGGPRAQPQSEPTTATPAAKPRPAANAVAAG